MKRIAIIILAGIFIPLFLIELMPIEGMPHGWIIPAACFIIGPVLIIIYLLTGKTRP